MTDLHRFVAPAGGEQPSDQQLEAASACLHRFTAAFNRGDVQAMDAELRFPHQMYSGAQSLTWATPGQHPVSFFADLKASGWARTDYESILPVLVAHDKVHFVVTYSRRNAQGDTLSLHKNLWIVTCAQGKWGIAVRSY